jgi:hypothetical protein
LRAEIRILLEKPELFYCHGFEIYAIKGQSSAGHSGGAFFGPPKGREREVMPPADRPAPGFQGIFFGEQV